MIAGSAGDVVVRFDRKKPRFDGKKSNKLSDINHIEGQVERRQVIGFPMPQCCRSPANDGGMDYRRYDSVGMMAVVPSSGPDERQGDDDE